MKKCNQVLELLSLYIDNELNEAEAKLVREHLEVCEACRAEFQELNEVVRMCNEIDEVDLPESFTRDLHVKLLEEQSKINDNRKVIVLRNRVLKAISSIAAVLMVVLIARGVMNINNKSGEKSILNTVPQEYAIDEKKDNKISNEDDGYTLSQDNSYGVASSENTGSIDKGKTIAILPDTTQALTVESTPEGLNKEDDKAFTSGVLVAGVPDETPDTNIILEFNEDVKGDIDSSKQYSVSGTIHSDVYLTLNSNYVEADVQKMSNIAVQFGNVQDAPIGLVQDPILSESTGKGEGGSNSVYKVSYTMDKSDYEKFIKEVNTTFSGRVSVINDMEQLNTRLIAINNYIAELETNSSDNALKLESLYEEKKNTLERIEIINSSDKIQVTITISQNP